MHSPLTLLHNWLLGRVLATVTAKDCPSKNEWLLTDRRKDDCYFTTIEIENQPLAVVFGYSNGIACIKYFIDGKYTDETHLSLEKIPLYSLRIIHYFRSKKFEFRGAYHWIITTLLPFRYLRIRIGEIFDGILQGRFNKKKIVTEVRMRVMEVMIKDRLSGRRQGYSVIDLIGRLHSDRIYLRPDLDQQVERLEWILESLRESDYLKVTNLDYYPTGRGIDVFEQHEEEQLRHRQAVFTQRVIAVLTFFVALPALIEGVQRIMSFLHNLD
jgi:hypothetical protein